MITKEVEKLMEVDLMKVEYHNKNGRGMISYM